MKDYVFILTIFCIIMLTSPVFAGNKLDGPLKANVIRIIDGDTFDVRAQIWVGQFIETRVRLHGIDTPELKGKCAHETQQAANALKALSQLIDQKQIILTNIKNGKYAGRVLASANTLDGISLTEHMINKGHARAYNGGKRKGWCDKTS